MKKLTPNDPNGAFGSCPTIYDPEDDSGEVIVVGRRVSSQHKERVSVGEEAIRISRDLLVSLK